MSLTPGKSSGKAPQEPKARKSAWLQFIKSIVSFQGDLTSLTAPPFLLAPYSIVEFSTYWAEYPRLFIAPALEESAEKRALLVAQWFLSTLRRQHASKEDDGTSKRMKPLNPFLGEIFLGQWVDRDSDGSIGITELVSEQVSHHPPATACRIWNEKHGVEFDSLVIPRAYFSSQVKIERLGYSSLRIPRYVETHYITMPPAHVEGMLSFQLNLELRGVSHIVSSSGFTTRFEYTGKGWLGKGESNSFKATISSALPSSEQNEKRKQNGEDEILYILQGQWSGSYTVTDARSGAVLETVDLAALKRTPLTVAPLQDQHPLESRRAWQHVVTELLNDDMLGVSREKSKVENAQRALRKEEKEDGRIWERRYFSAVDTDPLAEELRSVIEAEVGEKYMKNTGVACWKFDLEKYRAILAGMMVEDRYQGEDMRGEKKYAA
ncbi:Oxysterol-binding protein [Xylariaceae sp. FL0255]|nr:Oxysterol-binding protein [Xylariaceae sp. FL0255]